MDQFEVGEWVILKEEFPDVKIRQWELIKGKPYEITSVSRKGSIGLLDEKSRECFIKPDYFDYVDYASEELRMKKMQETNLHMEDLIILIDFALDLKDKEWFEQLINMKNKLEEHQFQ